MYHLAICKKLLLLLNILFFYNSLALTQNPQLQDTTRKYTTTEIMGVYYGGGGYIGVRLFLSVDTLVYELSDCTSITTTKGKWYLQDNQLYLRNLYSKADDDTVYRREEDEVYEFVQQDSFLVLVLSKYRDILYKHICKTHNAGWTAKESHLLHKKIANSPPVKYPTIPIEYQKFLLQKPISCKITKIHTDSLITINVGRKDGV